MPDAGPGGRPAAENPAPAGGAPKIALCLSGGGARAVAFHLGCLRALHDLGVLEKLSVVSAVSGGSIIGALWTAKAQPWDSFEEEVRAFLRGGILRRAFKILLTTAEGPKSAVCFFLTAAMSMALLAARAAASALGKKPPMAPLLRFSSRTTLLAAAMNRWLFNHRRLNQMDPDKPLLIINTTDLRSGTLFYFTNRGSGSGLYGRTVHDGFEIGEAVMSSAAYPFYVPAVDRMLSFERAEGGENGARPARYQARVVLSDGGVYDNLGLAPVMPGGGADSGIDVPETDTVICCRAGYGRIQEPPTHFLMSRCKNAISTAHKHTQILQLARLNEMKESGRLKDVIVPFLGQDDSVLHEAPESAVPKEKLVPRSVIDNYPTNLSAMREEWIDNLSARGEQLTRALIHKHAPHLIKKRSLPAPAKAG